MRIIDPERDIAGRYVVRRVVARFLDTGGFTVLSMVFVAILTDAWSDYGNGAEAALLFGTGTAFIMYVIYDLVMTAHFGQTVGKMLARVRVCRMEPNHSRWRAAGLRSAGLLLLAAPGVGWVLVPFAYGYGLFASDGRGLHDRLASTCIVDAVQLKGGRSSRRAEFPDAECRARSRA